MNKIYSLFLSLFIAFSLLITGCSSNINSKINKPEIIELNKENTSYKSEDYLTHKKNKNKPNITAPNFTINSIPKYNNKPFSVVNNNVPFFLPSHMTTKSFEFYSELDNLGRCGFAFANIGTDIMPTEKRESISHIKPSGWHSVKYDNVDGKNLYNRSHLIGFQLSAENANKNNLITGTRYFNVNGMLPFENMVADYVKETNNHVLYRVTPMFKDDNLICYGVLMEAKSVEDNGKGILFNVFVYNIQPEITIDYKTGESYLSKSNSKKVNDEKSNKTQDTKGKKTYILNTNSKKVHLPHCKTIKNLNNSNKLESKEELSKIKARGYSPCKICNPT